MGLETWPTILNWKNVGEMDSYYYQSANIKKEIVDAKQKQASLKTSRAVGEEFSTVPAEEISEKQDGISGSEDAGDEN